MNKIKDAVIDYLQGEVDLSLEESAAEIISANKLLAACDTDNERTLALALIATCYTAEYYKPEEIFTQAMDVLPQTLERNDIPFNFLDKHAQYWRELEEKYADQYSGYLPTED